MSGIGRIYAKNAKNRSFTNFQISDYKRMFFAERSVATFAKTSAWKITTTWLRDDSAFSFPNGRRQKGVWIYQLCQGT